MLAMSRHRAMSSIACQRRLACHQALHDPAREPRNGLRWLPELRRWQAERLERSFQRFLEDPHRAAAARFFLTDVYGDHDFSRSATPTSRASCRRCSACCRPRCWPPSPTASSWAS